jgi:hypothetical protein
MRRPKIGKPRFHFLLPNPHRSTADALVIERFSLESINILFPNRRQNGDAVGKSRERFGLRDLPAYQLASVVVGGTWPLILQFI